MSRREPLADASPSINPWRWTLIGLVAVVVTMAVSTMLPRVMPGFLPFMIAILAPLVTGIAVWSTRSLGEVTQPAGLDEARALLNGCPVPLLIIDFNGKIRFSNDECGDYGVPTGENPGPGMSSILHSQDVEPFLHALEAMAQTADSVEQIRLRLEAGGASVPVEARMARLRETNRVVVCLVEPIELPSPAVDESRGFQKKMDTICHGIQGPLVGISGVASALASSIVDETQGRWVEQLQSSSSQLVQIVEDLRFLVDLEAKRTRLKMEPVDLTSFLDGLIAKTIREHQWSAPLVPVIEKGVPDWVLTDRSCLEKILCSMLHHSMQVSPFSEIAISVALKGYDQGSAELIFSTYPTGENPASVIRQGQEKPLFYSLDIAQQFTRWMNGMLVHSGGAEPARYAFQVSLAQTRSQSMSPEEAKIRGVHAMLIDHLGTRRQGMLQRLERLGMHLEIVPDGELALSTLQREATGRVPVEVVVLYDDVDDHSGWELAKAIRELEPLPPVVLRVLPFGWQEETGQVTESMEWTDGLGLLREPVNQRELIEALDRVLRDWNPLLRKERP